MRDLTLIAAALWATFAPLVPVLCGLCVIGAAAAGVAAWRSRTADARRRFDFHRARVGRKD